MIKFEQSRLTSEVGNFLHHLLSKSDSGVESCTDCSTTCWETSSTSQCKCNVQHYHLLTFYNILVQHYSMPTLYNVLVQH